MVDKDTLLKIYKNALEVVLDERYGAQAKILVVKEALYGATGEKAEPHLHSWKDCCDAAGNIICSK